MKIIAAKFESIECRDKARDDIQKYVLEYHNSISRLDLALYRLEINKDYWLVVLTITSIPILVNIKIENTIQSYEGEIGDLPEEIYHKVLDSHIQHYSHAAMSGDKDTVYINHEREERDAIYSELLKPVAMDDNRPIIIQYRDKKRKAIDIAFNEQLINIGYNFSEADTIVSTTIYKIEELKLKRATQYHFDKSACAMLNAVKGENTGEWISQVNHLWVQFEIPYILQGFKIKALYVHNMDIEPETREVTGKDILLYKSCIKVFSRHKKQWSFTVVSNDLQELFDFTYDLEKNEYIYLPSHICPWRECKITTLLHNRQLGTCKPCENCKQALKELSQVLHTCIRMINKEYALKEEEISLPVRKEIYSEEVTTYTGKVGGKNRRKITKQAERELSYRVVSYEVSIAPSTSETDQGRGREETETETHRENWLMLHGKEHRIYKHKLFSGVSRKYTLPRYRNLVEYCKSRGGYFKEQEELSGTVVTWEYRLYKSEEGEEYVRGSIAPYKKWIPMLKPEFKKPVIHKVTAKKYTVDSKL